MKHFDLLNYRGTKHIRLVRELSDAFREIARSADIPAATLFGYSCRMIDGENIDAFGLTHKVKADATALVALGDAMEKLRLV